MNSTKISEVSIPEEYLIYSPKEELSFSDNFRMESEKLAYVPEPKDVMIAFFMSFPSSFRFLLHTREFIAKFLGLKTAPKSEKSSRVEKLKAFQGNVGDSVAIFDVLEKNKSELLTGQKDAHLDFKLSFLSFPIEKGVRIELATTVVVNNNLGKMYFSIVKPFHKFFLKRILRKMERTLIHKSW